VTYRKWTRETRELLLAERIVDQAHRAVREELLTVARHDPCRLLPSMLKRMKPEVREVRGLAVPVDAEDAAFVVEVVVLIR
jgi:hypothetical protein